MGETGGKVAISVIRKPERIDLSFGACISLSTICCAFTYRNVEFLLVFFVTFSHPEWKELPEGKSSPTRLSFISLSPLFPYLKPDGIVKHKTGAALLIYLTQQRLSRLRFRQSSDRQYDWGATLGFRFQCNMTSFSSTQNWNEKGSHVACFVLWYPDFVSWQLLAGPLPSNENEANIFWISS